MKSAHPQMATLVESQWHGDPAFHPDGIGAVEDRPLVDSVPPFWVPSPTGALLAIPIALVAMQVAVLVGMVDLFGALLLAAGLWALAAIAIGLPGRWRAHTIRQAADRAQEGLGLDQASRRIAAAVLARHTAGQAMLTCVLEWGATAEGMLCTGVYESQPYLGPTTARSAAFPSTGGRTSVDLSQMESATRLLPWGDGLRHTGALLHRVGACKQVAYHFDLRGSTAHARMGLLQALAA